MSLAVLTATAGVVRVHFLLTFVSGNSMEPTFATGDLLLVDKHAYRDEPPKRGDVVVARSTSGWIVKRIVGLPGEQIEVKGGLLFVNGRPLREGHKRRMGPLDLRKGRLFVERYALLGDNRSYSASSSVHAVVSREEIVGKVVWAIPRRL